MSDDVQSQINQMVAASAARVTNPQLARGSISGDTTGGIIATSDGTNTTIQRTSAPTAPPGRIPDNGIVTAVEAAKLKADIDALQDRLNQVSYHQDTGKPFHILEPGSREREVVEKQLKLAKDRAAYQLEVFRRLDEQRAADVAAGEEQRERERFVTGNPERAALLDRALAEREAQLTADRIIAARIKNAQR